MTTLSVVLFVLTAACLAYSYGLRHGKEQEQQRAAAVADVNCEPRDVWREQLLRDIVARDMPRGEEHEQQQAVPAADVNRAPNATTHEQLIRTIEAGGAWILRFRVDDEVWACLCDRPVCNTIREKGGLTTYQFVIKRLCGPMRYLALLQQNQVPRDLYFSPQHSGETTVVQQTRLAAIGGVADAGNDLHCWFNAIFMTSSELVTLSQLPAEIR